MYYNNSSSNSSNCSSHSSQQYIALLLLLLLFVLGTSSCGAEITADQQAKQQPQQQQLFALHSAELSSGELIIPRRVNSDGAFVTHQLVQHHNEDYQQQHVRNAQLSRQRRRRRAAESPLESDNDDNADAPLHYQLPLRDGVLHVELQPHSYFMTPQLVVERHRRDARKRTRPRKHAHCHYQGRVRGQNESRVALSTCHGLVGHIKTEHNEYYIEPSKLHDAHPSDGHPHIVFQRSSVKVKPDSNNNNNSSSSNNNNNHNNQQHHHQHQHRHNNNGNNKNNDMKRKQRKRKRQKLRQQQRQQQQQQQQQQQLLLLQQQQQAYMQQQLLEQQQQHRLHARSLSNCGTKEPRRRFDARLEWQPQGKVKIQGGRKIRRHHNHHHLQQQQQERSAVQTKVKHKTAEQEHNQNQKQHHQQQQQQHQYKHKQHKQQPQQQHQHQHSPVNENSVAKRAAASMTATTAARELGERAEHEHWRRFDDDDRNGNAIDEADDTDEGLHIAAADDADEDADGDDGGWHGAGGGAGGGDGHGSRRTKRSISSPRHVEALIVADATMVAFHKNDTERYLLTIMNMVSSLYKDPSIGNSIEIVVVKIILLEEEVHSDLNLTQNAQQNLDMFCSWQHKLNPNRDDRDPHHHDVAILVTRKNICGDNCMTLGLANVGGMCKPKRSCSVNEDNGIMLSHTIAHELGHNFGMFHDTAKIGCHPRVGSIVHIMTPTFGADTLQVCWSNCSRKFITNFLDQGLGDCLDDAPTEMQRYIYPERQPGVDFDAALQCRLQFNLTDADVGVCSSPYEICSTLWCEVNGECVTNLRPTAPGTSCGKHKWCRNGKCVRVSSLKPIDGDWGAWSPWSECSRSCGGGISIQQRECDNPRPANDGVFCIGERKRYRVCNSQACAPTEPSFRAQQCAAFNDVPYQGAKYKWLPFFDKKNPCKLLCSDGDETVVATWADSCKDGTACKLGTNNMCIDGICKQVGCDWQLDSEMQEDACGVCGGNGTHCRSVQGTLQPLPPLPVSEGYIALLSVPARARHIYFRELNASVTPHFLAIGATDDAERFYLNGGSLISMPGEFEIAGAESLYERSNELEAISIPQPIQHSITLYIIARGSTEHAGVYYNFTLPAAVHSATSAPASGSAGATHSWRLSPTWTPCSASCGGGLQYRLPRCYAQARGTSDEQRAVADELCWSPSSAADAGAAQRPLRDMRTCNTARCPAHWWTGPWQFCPVTCRQPTATTAAARPLRRRTVMCLDSDDRVVDDEQCELATRPIDLEHCDQHLPVCGDGGEDGGDGSGFMAPPLFYRL